MLTLLSERRRVKQQNKKEKWKTLLFLFLAKYKVADGADDEIWTHAAVSRTTPLAGEPLEPLGYIRSMQILI